MFAELSRSEELGKEDRAIKFLAPKPSLLTPLPPIVSKHLRKDNEACPSSAALGLWVAATIGTL